MRKVSLVLASGPGFPQGSADHRYELSLRPDPTGRLNPELWYADPEPWPVLRCWPGDAPRPGTVQHDNETGWAMHFDRRPDQEGDPSLHCRLLTSPFLRPGEYITVQEPDGLEYGYRIVQVG